MRGIEREREGEKDKPILNDREIASSAQTAQKLIPSILMNSISFRQLDSSLMTEKKIARRNCLLTEEGAIEY